MLEWVNDRPIRIGVSACLLGARVRFDGGHKRSDSIAMLCHVAELVPMCPEFAIGLGVPREPLRLTQIGGEIRLVGGQSGHDITRAMRQYAARRVRELEMEQLSGYIFKKNSPSCGMVVPVYHAEKAPTLDGRGLFAATLLEHFPNLPVEEEDKLDDRRVRENFVERVLAYHRIAERRNKEKQT
ncbi:MAG: DUF523 domain-containing protein [Candidatus Binataceae bacterium]